MQKQTIRFSNSSTDLYFAAGFGVLKKLVDQRNAVIITDENVFRFHQNKFGNWNTIVLKAGEQYKTQATVDTIIEQLINMQADRTTVLVGVGGGVVTDITGYVASVYMRGLKFGFVPTTLLAMVDASIGGKNGVDVNVYKNIVGTINQPSFILHDMIFLESLPEAEWQNGFAEIIKHAAISNTKMFEELEKRNIAYYSSKKKAIGDLIQQNALLKIKLVQKDEFEKANRKLLNFGHTLGHAIENQYELSHGQAIAIGMTYASHISEHLCGFKATQRVVSLLERYELPTYAAFDKKKVMKVLLMDKKRERKELNFILLQRIGKALIKPVAVDQLEKIIQSL
jgi:3-dehydroquinate synthase